MLDYIFHSIYITAYTLLGENWSELSQDSGVVDQYIYSATIVGLTQHKDESEAISQTSHRVYILKIYLTLETFMTSVSKNSYAGVILCHPNCAFCNARISVLHRVEQAKFDPYHF